MEKRPLNVPFIVLSTLGVITLIIVISFIYFSINGKDYSNVYAEKLNSGEIQNPTTQFSLSNKSNEGERVININTSEGEKTIIIRDVDIGNITNEDIEKVLINYMGVYLKFYNLHDIPFTPITPKIQVYIEDKPYFLEISDGDIILATGISKNPDIIIRTTYEEIFKIAENPTYVKESISLEKTSIEIVSSKFILFSKGYLSLYDELKGSFTGYTIVGV